MKNYKTLLAVCAIILLAVGCNSSKIPEPQKPQVYSEQTLRTQQIKVKDQTLTVEVADSDGTRTQGLSGRKYLAEGTGMLFDFSERENFKPNFWMKQMNFDIDIIWIKNNKIVWVTPQVPAPSPTTPLNELPLYSPPTNITHVLEVPSGWSEKYNIKIGDEIIF